MKVIQKLSRLGASALVTAVTLLGTSQPALANPSGGTCQEHTVNVALAEGQAANKVIKGTLCVPTTWAEGDHQIDLLVHGATYNRQYWDWPVNPATYSYVEDTLQSGRATFAYDRLGTGQSSTPLSAQVTITADSYVMHQVVQWLRGGTNNYPQVNAIGHSFGSIVAIQEAADYQDVDRLVVTGLLHSIGTVYFSAVGSVYPAMLDAQFPGLLDPGYLTTQPGIRGTMFYNSTVDPAVLAYDEAHKDKVSGAQFADGMTRTQLPAALNGSQGITAPVLSVVGDQDTLFCGLLLTCTPTNVQANEAPYYTNAASFNTAVISNTAHDLALHPTAPATFATINTWITTH